MYTIGVPREELYQRIELFQKLLKKSGTGGALIVHKPDLFYFSGTMQQGWLYIPSEGDPIFFVFKEYSRAKEESGLEKIVSHISPKTIPETLVSHGYHLPEKLGLEMDVLPASQYLMFKEIFKGSTITDATHQIKTQRAVKSEYEIGLMKRSAQMADKVAAHVPDILKPGMTEIEFAGLVEAFARKLGHQGIIRMRMFGNDLFYGHIMAGANAAVPSYFASPTGGKGLSPAISQGPGFNIIKENEPVLVDYVFVLDGYICDHTRIFSIGDLPDELNKAHTAMLEIQDQVSQQARPGSITGELYDLMIDLASQKGYADVFMGAGERKIRFSGHGVGLELDEYPFLAKGQAMKLEKGMTIALEPKTVIPGKGVVGIENTWVVNDTGLERLSQYPDEIVNL
jgi:Xaa-Pro dipeptidase